MYFDQLLLAPCKVHVVYLDQLLGASPYIHIISNHDTLICNSPWKTLKKENTVIELSSVNQNPIFILAEILFENTNGRLNFEFVALGVWGKIA